MKRYSRLFLSICCLSLLTGESLAQDWTSSQTINEPSGTTSNIDFGQSLSVDGTTAVVGAPLQNAVHVYELIASVWTFRVTLTPSDLAVGDQFGFDVAVEGDVIVVGSLFAGPNSEGQVYIWEKPAGGWEVAANEDIILTNSAASSASGGFGHSIDINGDELLIGAATQTVGSTTGHGQVYLFSKPSGASWKIATEEANFLHPVSSSDNFGFSVALEHDQLAVGAPFTGGNAGNAFVFERYGANWTSKSTADAVLRKPNRSSSEAFGSVVVSTGDFFVMSAGSITNTYKDAYVFKTPAAGWSTEFGNNGTLEPEYVISRDPASLGLTFGISLAASGNLLTVGDRSHGLTNATRYGKVWVYQLGASSASLVEEILAPSPLHLAKFGEAVAISEGEIFVGAPDQTTVGQVFSYSGEYQVSVSDVICFGGSYDFDGQILTSSGTYNATLTASNGLDSLVTLTLTQNPQLNFAFSFDPILCNGETGGITFDSPTGGNGGPYEYSVDGGANFQVSPVFAGLSSGPLTLVIRDGVGCTRSEGTFLQQPAPIAIASTNVTDPNCFSSNDGSVSLQVTGGSSAYSYSLDGTNYTFNGAGINTTVTFGSLTAGSYTLYVKDGNDCEVTTNVTLTDPTQIAISATITDPLCDGESSGAITNILATGGNGGPYTYSLDGTTFQATNQFTGLTAGVFTVVVQDNGGCFRSQTYTLTDPAPISAVATITNSTSCSVPDGIISLAVSGGSGGYSYTLDGAPATNPFNGLSGGTYAIEVTDSNGCTLSLSETVSEPMPPGVAVNFTDISCNGASDGTFSAVGFNGVAPYEYSFDGAPFGSSQVATGLDPGAHTVVVRDANGCTESSTVSLFEPDVLSIDAASATDPNCYQGGDGAISLTVSGGTPIYMYSLDGTNFSNFDNISGVTIPDLTAGSYSITVRDLNNCTATTNVTLSEPPMFDFTATISGATCFGESDGMISSIAAAGGNGAPYTYSIDGTNFQSNSSFTGLPGGPITIYVEDANGCVISRTETVSEPTEITASVTKVETSTCGALDGQIAIVASGGVAPYSYALNGGSSQSSGTFSGLSSGLYVIDITDGAGCITTLNEVISDPVTATITTSTTDAFCAGSTDGAIVVSVMGGTTPYEYSLDGGAFQTSNEFNNLAAGTYSVNVREANGCIQSVTGTVSSSDPSLDAVGTASYSTTYGSSISTWGFMLDPQDNVSTHFFIDNVQGSGLTLGANALTGNDFITIADVANLVFTPGAAGNFSFDIQTSLGASSTACLSGSPLTISISVDPTPLSITADDQSKVYGEANPTLTISYAGFVNGEDASALTMAPSITTTATTSSVVGTYPIAVSGATSDNYDITYSNGTLTITQASLTATANDQSITFGDALPSLDGTLSGVVNGDNITASYATTASASSGAGTYPITVSLNDPDTRLGNYSTTLTDGTLTISKADQVITFGTIADIDLATANTVSLTATADSGLPITYTLDQGDGSISGTTLTVNTTGNFTVTASQDGDDDYNAASSVSQSFQVVDSRKTDQTITFTQDLTGKTYGEAPFTLTATASSQLAVSYSSTGPVSIGNGEATILGAGEATITAEQAGDGTYNPATSVTQTFTIGQASLTATADDATITFGDALPMYTVSYAGFVGSDDASDLDTPPTATSAATSSSDAGTYAIVASGGQDDNYTFTYVDGNTDN